MSLDATGRVTHTGVGEDQDRAGAIGCWRRGDLVVWHRKPNMTERAARFRIGPQL